MIRQPSLPGFGATPGFFTPEAIPDPEGKLKGYSLLVAIVPSPDDALRTAQFARELQMQRRLNGKLRPVDILHITLHELPDMPFPIPMAYLDAARFACASVVCPRFRVVLDQVCAFGRSTDASESVFLHCDHGSSLAVARLRNALAKTLRRVGVRCKPTSTPHVTLLYGDNPIFEASIAPVAWNVTRFTLILSHVGLTYHERIDEWSLA